MVLGAGFRVIIRASGAGFRIMFRVWYEGFGPSAGFRNVVEFWAQV